MSISIILETDVQTKLDLGTILYKKLCETYRGRWVAEKWFKGPSSYKGKIVFVRGGEEKNYSSSSKTDNVLGTKNSQKGEVW